MKQIIEEKGSRSGFTGLGCVWIPKLPSTNTLLFFCFDQDDLRTSPYLFHFSWKGDGDVLERLQKVKSMTTKGFQLKNSKTVEIPKQLQSHFQWIRKWEEKNTTFEPSKHCRVAADNSDNLKNYLLTCEPEDSSKGRTWRKLPKGQVEKADPKLMATA